MKKGELVATQNEWGDITLFRAYPQKKDCADYFSVYLNFNMSTEHSHIQRSKDIVALDVITKLIKDENAK